MITLVILSLNNIYISGKVSWLYKKEISTLESPILPYFFVFLHQQLGQY